MNNESLYPSLLAPLTLAGKRLRNRLVHASMTTLMGENTRVTQRLIQYHANRARLGTARRHQLDRAARGHHWRSSPSDRGFPRRSRARSPKSR